MLLSQILPDFPSILGKSQTVSFILKSYPTPFLRGVSILSLMHRLGYATPPSPEVAKVAPEIFPGSRSASMASAPESHLHSSDLPSLSVRTCQFSAPFSFAFPFCYGRIFTSGSQRRGTGLLFSLVAVADKTQAKSSSNVLPCPCDMLIRRNCLFRRWVRVLCRWG